jgi:cell division protein FtsI (penicillin-binding protein 3)
MQNQKANKKILVLYLILFALFMAFGVRVFYVSLSDRELSINTTYREKAQRGSIISSDNYHIAYTKKLYKVSVDTREIPAEKRELFAKMFSIYAKTDKEEILELINSRVGNVILSYSIDPRTAQRLKFLGRELIQSNVFVPHKNAQGQHITYGLSTMASGASRVYPYRDVLTPVLGYFKKYEESYYTKVEGIKGLERQYENTLRSQSDGKKVGYRDVIGNMILNKEVENNNMVSGVNLHLNVNLSLQKRLEVLLSNKKEEFQAKDIIVGIMESETGKIVSLASSNRFNPKNIKRNEYSHLNVNAIEYGFEPGSVLKPMIFALLLEEKKIQPLQLVYCENGRYKIGERTIKDEHKLGWVGAEDIIVYSSNIGIAKIAQKLDAIDYYQGLVRFGFTQESGIELPFEKTGSIPTINKLNSKTYKATISYGYGLTANFMQLLASFNVFNNKGILISPKLVDYFTDYKGRRVSVSKNKPQTSRVVVSHNTSKIMQDILVKTVEKGTGRGAIIKGLVIGGKTGTAHIVERGKYVDKYNSSFFGFVNDENKKYTVGVTVIEPKTAYFASKTAVPVFKSAIELMIDNNFLKPKQGF